MELTEMNARRMSRSLDAARDAMREVAAELRAYNEEELADQARWLAAQTQSLSSKVAMLALERDNP